MSTRLERRSLQVAYALCSLQLGATLAHAGQYDPLQPPIRTEDREMYIRCAAGAVQTRLPNARVLVIPAKNHTNVVTLQSSMDDAFVKTAGDLTLDAYPASDGFNELSGDPKLYDYVLRAEVSVVDRAVTTDELKREFGVDFGGGRGASYIGTPSTERWTVGWVTTTVNVFKTEIRKTSQQTFVTAMKLVSSAAARGAFFTLGNSDGVNASVVLTYGRQATVEKQAGMQRAALGALRAGTARAILRVAGVPPDVCGL